MADKLTHIASIPAQRPLNQFASTNITNELAAAIGVSGQSDGKSILAWARVYVVFLNGGKLGTINASTGKYRGIAFVMKSSRDLCDPTKQLISVPGVSPNVYPGFDLVDDNVLFCNLEEMDFATNNLTQTAAIQSMWCIGLLVGHTTEGNMVLVGNRLGLVGCDATSARAVADQGNYAAYGTGY